VSSAELDALRRRYLQFAETECRGYSPLYHQLSFAVAQDDEILRFIVARPERQPNLFLAAVQFVAGGDRMPRGAAELRALLRTDGDSIAAVMARRRTQTNEVGRCAVLLPAMPRGPLAIVEVGASAGLCLLFDRYHYDYGYARIGPASSPVRLECLAAGAVPLPGAMPQVVWRRGLDIAPVDVRDEQAIRWLHACVWADHAGRRERLNAAVSLARNDPPAVLFGDLVDDLPGLIARAPGEARLVVFHSAVLAYVSPQRREAFQGVLARASKDREIVWISNEAATGDGGQFSLTRTTLVDGRATIEPLALVHPHGARMSWLSREARD
jgi:hypothetical protein